MASGDGMAELQVKWYLLIGNKYNQTAVEIVWKYLITTGLVTACLRISSGMTLAAPIPNGLCVKKACKSVRYQQ